MWEIVRVVFILLNHLSDNCLLRDERKIFVGILVTYKPWSVIVNFLFGKMSFQYTCNSIDLLGVALGGTRYFLWMEDLELGRLTIVQALL
jgi:hypothetical protein